MKLLQSVRVKRTNKMVRLSKELFLSTSHCDCCNRSGLEINNNDDAKNMLGFTACLSCQEDEIQ